MTEKIAVFKFVICVLFLVVIILGYTLWLIKDECNRLFNNYRNVVDEKYELKKEIVDLNEKLRRERTKVPIDCRRCEVGLPRIGAEAEIEHLKQKLGDIKVRYYEAVTKGGKKV